MAVVTLDEVKRHLNITSGDYDGELQGFLNAALAAITERVGPLEPTVATARLRGAETLALPVVPVVSLTSVTPVGGSALTVGDLDLDERAGVIATMSGSRFGSRHYDIAYVAGRAECPADLKLAVKELVRHFWDTQRGPTRRPGSTTSDATSNTVPGAAYAFPFRVEQLLAPHELHLGFGFA